MQSRAKTVKEYLAELPPDRRAAIRAVRQVILENLDKRMEEGMGYGMIVYSVPHSVYPPGYHCTPEIPLPYTALASQKQYMSLYLSAVYCGCGGVDETEDLAWLRKAWAKSGKKLDMGKSCIRFKKVEDLPLDVIGEAVRRVTVKDYIERYEKARKETTAKKAAPQRKATSRAAMKADVTKPVKARAKASSRA